MLHSKTGYDSEPEESDHVAPPRGRQIALRSFLIFAAGYLVQVIVRRRRVLIVDRCAPSLGDVLCVAACLPALRAKHSNAWIVLVCAPQNQVLMAATHAADAVVVRGSASYFLLARRRHRRFRPLLPDEEDPPRRRPSRHLSAEFGAILDVPAPSSPCAVHVSPDVRQRISRNLAAHGLGNGFVAVHTGPTWRVKEWPGDAWKELARLIHERLEIGIVQIGTDMTSEQCNRAAPRFPGAIDWVNRLSLIESAAVIERARVFVGIDSGPLHLASSLGRPIVGLFGPTDGNAFLYAGPGNRVVQAQIPCIGCHHHASGPRHWREDCPESVACMRALSPEEVFSQIVGLIATRTFVQNDPIQSGGNR